MTNQTTAEPSMTTRQKTRAALAVSCTGHEAEVGAGEECPNGGACMARREAALRAALAVGCPRHGVGAGRDCPGVLDGACLARREASAAAA